MTTANQAQVTYAEAVGNGEGLGAHVYRNFWSSLRGLKGVGCIIYQGRHSFSFLGSAL